MGALAGLLHELGHDVSGSDVAFHPPMGPSLREWGIVCLEGFDPRHLEPAPDLVVIGNVCRPDNPEARAAIDRGLPYTHIAGALQRFVLENTDNLVVAGTHGKTTTTALAAWLLDQARLEPGFLIGGIPKNFGRSFRAPGRGKLMTAGSVRPSAAPPFVIEGDEYDTAFFEKTAKFLHYRPRVAVITSIEHDHIDIYPTPTSYNDAFRRFLVSMPENGLIIANAADRAVVTLVQEHATCEISYYARQGDEIDVAPHWLAAPSQPDATGTAFDLFAGGVACGRFATPLLGRHNLSNTVAAIAAVAQGFGVRLDVVGSALARFASVKRRQEILGTPRGITVYDDFAHHPTAVQETLDAIRQRHAPGRVFAVFEPRSATACRSLHQREYVAAFDAADEVLFPPLGRSNIPAPERLDLERLVSDLSRRGKTAEARESVESIVEALADRARPGDAIALLSNGAFGGIHERLLRALEA